MTGSGGQWRHVAKNDTPATTFAERRYASETADPLGAAALACAPRSIMAAISPMSSTSKPLSAECYTTRSMRPRGIANASAWVLEVGQCRLQVGDLVAVELG
jgi:hypothetical protein